MPCRALEAFRQRNEHGGKPQKGQVLMPCRALEAFRRLRIIRHAGAGLGLNALSGIGGVQTRNPPCPSEGPFLLGLNALSGIGGVQTSIVARAASALFIFGLNALSGIGGVQTNGDPSVTVTVTVTS